MASLETIGPLMVGMKCRPDMAGLACEALNRMFQKEQTELVAQVLFMFLMSSTRAVLNERFIHSHCVHVRAGSESGAGSIPPKAAGGSRPGDTG